MSNLQKKLMVILALLLAVQALAMLWVYALSVREGLRPGDDFIVFWEAARHALTGNVAAIYNPAPLTQMMQDGKVPQMIAPFAYPPQALLFLAPLGYVDYYAAFFIWSALPLLLFAVLLRRMEAARDPMRFALGFAAMLPFIMANFFSGQTGLWLALLFMAIAMHWDKRPWLAAICIGLLSVKPQLMILFPVALIAQRRWRMLLIAIATAAIMEACATLWLGWDIWMRYLEMVKVFGEFASGHFAPVARLVLAPYMSLKWSGMPDAAAIGAQAVLSVAAIVMVFKAFRQESPWRFALLACGALIATPHAMVYDTPLLVLAILPLLAECWKNGWRNGMEMAVFIALLLMPYLQPQMMPQAGAIGWLVISLFFAMLYRRHAQAVKTPR